MDKKLVALGAECVAGDLILNRETVGMYRHGQFIPTAAGEAALKAAEDVKQTADVGSATSTEAPAAPKPKPVSARKAKPAAAPAETPGGAAAETAATDAASETPAADDLTAGLDELLG